MASSTDLGSLVLTGSDSFKGVRLFPLYIPAEDMKTNCSDCHSNRNLGMSMDRNWKIAEGFTLEALAMLIPTEAFATLFDQLSTTTSGLKSPRRPCENTSLKAHSSF